MFPDADTAHSKNETEKVASNEAKPSMAKDSQHEYVDVVLVCEVVKEKDCGDSLEEKVDHSSFPGFETELLQYNIKELLSKSQPTASDCSDEKIILDLQELHSEDMLSATRSFGLFSFSSDSSGVINPTLSEFSSFELYELEGSSYCCDDLSIESFKEDYEETNHIQDNRQPLEAFRRIFVAC